MDNDTLIQKHLKNQLSKEEQTIFESLVKNDASFSEEVKFQVNLNTVIRAEDRISLKKRLQRLENTTKQSSLLKWSIAASFSLLILLGGFYFFKQGSLSNQDLFAENFSPSANVLHPVVRGDASKTEIENAFVFYENNEFQKFINHISKTAYTNPDYDFFIANAYLAIGNASEAIPILKKYLTSTTINFKDSAHWYLGLAYLKEKRQTLAKSQFELLNNKSDYNYTKAKEILQKIK
jgi:tetratricopeptide (TPR) repeat protein